MTESFRRYKQPEVTLRLFIPYSNFYVKVYILSTKPLISAEYRDAFGK